MAKPEKIETWQQIRHHVQMTQQQVAEAAKLSLRTVAYAEQGKGLTLQTATALASAMGLELAVYVGPYRII